MCLLVINMHGADQKQEDVGSRNEIDLWTPRHVNQGTHAL